MRKVLFVILFLVMATLTHAASLVVRGQNAAGCFDGYVVSAYPTRGYGLTPTLSIWSEPTNTRFTSCSFTNIDTIGAGQVVDSVFLSLWCTNANAAYATVVAYEQKKPAVEGSGNNSTVNGDMTWTSWKYAALSSVDSLWGLPGAMNASDAGAQNSCYTGQTKFNTGYQVPTAAAGNWTNPTNVYASDNVRAYALTSTYYFSATGFGFNLPTTAVIDTMFISFEGYYTTAPCSVGVRLTKNGTAGVGDQWNITLTTTDSVYTSAQSAILWGTTWTPAEINASTFGVRVEKYNEASSAAYCDQVRINVVYHDPGADRASSGLDTLLIYATDVPGWFSWNLGSTLPSAWYDGTKLPYGIILRQTNTTGGQLIFKSSEATAADTAHWPTWTIYYHAAGMSEEPCVPTGAAADSCYLQTVRTGYVPNFELTPETLRVVAIVVSDDDGTDQYKSDSVIENGLDSLDRLVADSLNWHIDYSISHVRDSYWADNTQLTDQSYTNDLLAFFAANSLLPDSQCHFFVCQGPQTVTMGYRSATAISIENPIIIKAVSADFYSFAHEFGHRFWLYHTHEGVGDWGGGGTAVACDNPCREWPQTYTSIPDSARYVVGDRCLDTKADPGFSGANLYSSLDTVCQDSSFGTVSPYNVMSYGNDVGPQVFTQDQATIMAYNLLKRFLSWKTGGGL